MGKQNCLFLLDVGGTQIKAAVMSENGETIVPQQVFESKANEEQNKILNHFAAILHCLADMIKADFITKAVIMAFPGPFDNENGISRIEGLSKYQSIYGISIREELYKIVNPEIVKGFSCKTDILFINDVAAFALGEIDDSTKKYMCVCIGTGAGSAFIKSGKILENYENMPSNGWIYNCPFKKSVIDDYISARGLKRIAFKIMGKDVDGLELYSLASTGDKAAKTVFNKFGKDVCAALGPIIEQFKPDTLIIGGQISKSFEFFGNDLKSFCDKSGVKIKLSEALSDSVFKGLMYYIKNKESN